MARRQDASRIVERAGERLQILPRVVHTERDSGGRGDPEATHEGLRAVMTGTDGDSSCVEDGPDVVRVRSLQRERQDTNDQRLARAPDTATTA